MGGAFAHEFIIDFLHQNLFWVSIPTKKAIWIQYHTSEMEQRSNLYFKDFSWEE